MEYELIISDLSGYRLCHSESIEELKKQILSVIDRCPLAEILPAADINIGQELDEQFWTDLIRTRIESPRFHQDFIDLNRRDMYVLYNPPYHVR